MMKHYLTCFCLFFCFVFFLFCLFFCHMCMVPYEKKAKCSLVIMILKYCLSVAAAYIFGILFEAEV